MKYLTIKEVAEELNCKVSTIQRKVREKEIYSIKLFGSSLIRVPSTELERIIKEGGIK